MLHQTFPLLAAVALIAGLPSGTLIAGLPIQGSSQRHLVVGKIDDEDGEWQGARVLFFSQSRLEGIEAEDAAHGRQRHRHDILARLQPRREYRVTARLDREGMPTLWTRIEKIAADASSFELRPSRFAPSRPKVRIHGRDAWKDHSPLEFRLLDALGRSRRLDDCLDKDGRLPSLPGSLCWIEMRMAGGRRLHLFPIALKKKDCPETLDLRLPPPIQIRLRVLDANTDAPIEGARVFDDLCRNEDISSPGLRTDAKGKVWFWMARPTDDLGELDRSRPMLFRILAKGRQLACAGWNNQHLAADKRIPMPGKAGALELEVHMSPGKALQGKLLNFPSSVLGKIRLFARLQFMMPAPQEVRTWTGLPWFEIRIQADGRYELPRLSTDQGYLQQGLYFPDELLTLWRKLQVEGKALSRSQRILPLPSHQISKGEGDYRLPFINNKILQLLDLRVRLTNGRRGRDMPIHILFPDSETSTSDRTRLLGRVDGGGRFRRLHYGVTPALYVQGPKGYALMEENELAALRRKEPGKPCMIRLKAMPTIRGTILLPDGTPASLSRIRLRPYRPLRKVLRGGLDGRYLKALTSFALNTEVTAKKDGSFEIPYLPFPERLLLLSASLRNSDGSSRNVYASLNFGHSQEVDLVFSR